MSKKLKNIVGMAAPLAGLIPGVGWPLAMALGAGGGLLSGGGLKGALAGGLSGGLLGGAGKILGGTLGLSGPLGSGIGNALLGAGAGGATSGLKGALAGGAIGGLGGYANAGGFDGLGQSLGITGPNSLLGEFSSSGAQLPWQTPAGMPWGGGQQLPWQAASQGSGALGALSKAGSGISNLLGAGTSAGGSSYSGGAGNLLSNALGGVSSYYSADKAEDALLDAQKQALAKYQPYIDSEFNPGDLTQDPGYQFRLKEGEKAIGRQQAAKGNYFSGGALKAAQEFGQGLADSTYNDAFNRFMANKAQNVGIAGNMADLFMQGGNAKAGASIAKGNALSKAFAGALGGYGAYSPWSYNPYQYGYGY